MECPACSSKRVKRVDGSWWMYRCQKCQAVFGDTYLGDSYAVVKPWFHPQADSVPQDAIRYYDFTCCGSAGITRRHGWYDPATGYIIQTG